MVRADHRSCPWALTLPSGPRSRHFGRPHPNQASWEEGASPLRPTLGDRPCGDPSALSFPYSQTSSMSLHRGPLASPASNEHSRIHSLFTPSTAKPGPSHPSPRSRRSSQAMTVLCPENRLRVSVLRRHGPGFGEKQLQAGAKISRGWGSSWGARPDESCGQLLMATPTLHGRPVTPLGFLGNRVRAQGALGAKNAKGTRFPPLPLNSPFFLHMEKEIWGCHHLPRTLCFTFFPRYKSQPKTHRHRPALGSKGRVPQTSTPRAPASLGSVRQISTSNSQLGFV